MPAFLSEPKMQQKEGKKMKKKEHTESAVSNVWGRTGGE